MMIPEECDFRATILRVDKTGLRKMRALADREGMKVRQSPSIGLVMLRVKDSCDVEFCLGEVLVTEAEVEYRGCRGYGIATGDEPERAYLIASVDAIFQSGNIGAITEIRSIIVSQKKRIDRKLQREASLVADTKVSFETL